MTCTISTQRSLQTVFACLRIYFLTCMIWKTPTWVMSYHFKYCLTHITLRESHKYTWSDVLSTLSPHLNPVKQGRIWIDVLHTQLHNHQIFWKTDTDPSFQRLGKSMPGYIEASNLCVHHVVMLQSVAACSCYTCAKQKWKIKSSLLYHSLNIC